MDTWNLIESNILVWIQNHLRIEVLDQVMPHVSAINNAGILAILTVAVLLLWKKYRPVGITAFSSLLVEWMIVNLLLKPLVHRIRPFHVNDMLVLLGDFPTDYSFPSGHSGSAFAVATVMLLCMPKRYGVTSIIVATLIAFSRLYNGAHYPTDVLTGSLVGVITGVIASKVILPRITKRLCKVEKQG